MLTRSALTRHVPAAAERTRQVFSRYACLPTEQDAGQGCAIIEKTDQVGWYTHMRGVFEAANIAPQDYDWYVSDIETNWKPSGFCWEDQWFTGNELATFLHAHEVQFIWAVFSAVPKGFRSTPASAPYVENNPRYRDGTEPGPQIEGALFEIACGDSSGTIVINLPAQTIQSFLTRYPDTKPLATARS
jgi:hypothetical protein